MSIASSVANDRLVDLRNRKKLAIQSLDFDTAEQLDEEIRKQNEMITTQRINHIHGEIMKELYEHLSKFKSMRDEMQGSNNKEEAMIEAQYQASVAKMKQQHEKELRNIDKAHSTSLLREAEREVPEQFDILEKSKEAAMSGDYARARQLRDEARRVGEQQLQSRKDKVDREFSESRAMLCTKQQEALDQLSDEHEKKMSQISFDEKMKRIELDQRYEAGLGVIRQRAEVRCKALLADEDVKENALFEINQKIDEAVRESGYEPLNA